MPARSILRTAAIVAVLLISISVAVALAMLAPRMPPVKRGNAAEFWNVACGIGEDRYADSLVTSRAFVVDGDNYVAYSRTFTSTTHTFSVPKAEVLAQLPAVTQQLGEKAARSDTGPFVMGYLRWRDEEPARREPLALVGHCREALLAFAYRQGGVLMVEHAVASDFQFQRQWRQRDWYWATIAFEWLLLTGLALWVLWPAIRGGSRLRWAVHIGLTPLLFFLPLYFGYATTTFTSAGPSGGVVYPFLIVWFRRGPFTDFDAWLLQHWPPLLEPLSTPIGDFLARTSFGFPGPTALVVTSVVIGGGVYAVSSIVRQLVLDHTRRRENLV